MNRSTPRTSPDNSRCESVKEKRIEMLHDEVNTENVGVSSMLSLLLIRARDLCAEYTRMWRCYAGGDVQPVLCDSPEGDGSELSRTQNMRDYVQCYVLTLKDLRAKLMRNFEAQTRCIKSNKGGRVLKRQLRARSQAVISDYAGRRGEFDKFILSSSNSGASALAPITIRAEATAEKDNEIYLAPAVGTNDNNFIPNDTDVDDVGVRKASTGDKLITAHTCSYNTGDLGTVRSIDDQIAFSAEKGRSRRHRAKKRKRALKGYIKGKIPNPPSGDDI